MKYIMIFFSSFILAGVQIYAWYRIADKKINFLSIKSIISILFLTLYSLFNFNIINPFIKSCTMIIGAIVFCKLLLNISIKKCIIIVGIDYLILMIFDALFGLSLLIISNNDFNKLFETYSGGMIANCIIGLGVIFALNCKKTFNIIKKIYSFILKHTTNIKEYETFFYLIIIISCSAAAYALTYYYSNKILTIIINTCVIIIYAIIILRIIRTKNNFIAISSKYNLSLDNLQAQEMIINDYRIINHENKNNLLAIKGMTSNKKIIVFINSLLHQNSVVNEKIMNETYKLPEGGIRGLIYSKILIMREKNIECNLNVDKRITIKLLYNISDNDIVDICQILGVFIDNAMEECYRIDKKEIQITLHIQNNCLIIEISNYHNRDYKSINKSIQIKSTKGKGHGYGLQLVKRLIENNKKLRNERLISKEIFTQKLIIDIK